MKLVHTVAVAAVVLFLGCAGGGKKEAPPAAEKPAAQVPAATSGTSATPTTSAKPATSATSATPVAPVDGAMVEMVGTTGCGHCTFHKTGSCAVAIQTAEGHFYVVDGVAENTEVWNQRFEGKQLKVKGRLGQKDGLPHIAAESFAFVQ